MKTKKEMSRQRKWQMKMVAGGKCQTCGKPQIKESNYFCEEHYKKPLFLIKAERYEKMSDLTKLHSNIIHRIEEASHYRLPEQYIFALIDCKKMLEAIDPLAKLVQPKKTYFLKEYP